MNQRRRLNLIALTALLSALFAPARAHAQPRPPTIKLPAQAEPLLIAAAADLAPLESHLQAEFLLQTGLQCKFTFGASGMLAHQIEYGAPYDVFLSANEAFVTQLAASGHVERESVVLYATGRLGVWAPKQPISTLADLLRPGFKTIAIANPAHAPYGAAAADLLRNQGLWDKLSSHLVFGENVRQAFEYAKSGNADAVITAWSLLRELPDARLVDARMLVSPDARRSGTVNKSAPQTSHASSAQLPTAARNSFQTNEIPVIRQAAAVVSASHQLKAAHTFLTYLLSPEGQTVLRSHGLFPPPEPAKTAR